MTLKCWQMLSWANDLMSTNDIMNSSLGRDHTTGSPLEVPTHTCLWPWVFRATWVVGSIPSLFSLVGCSHLQVPWLSLKHKGYTEGCVLEPSFQEISSVSTYKSTWISWGLPAFQTNIFIWLQVCLCCACRNKNIISHNINYVSHPSM